MDSEDSYIGKQIGNYRVVDELGGGGFGNVYRAQHIFLAKRIVAIKLLNASRLNSRKERESFLQEAQLLEMLKHSYILPFIDFGINEGDMVRRLNRHDEALAAYEHATQLEAGGM